MTGTARTKTAVAELSLLIADFTEHQGTLLACIRALASQNRDWAPPKPVVEPQPPSRAQMVDQSPAHPRSSGFDTSMAAVAVTHGPGRDYDYFAELDRKLAELEAYPEDDPRSGARPPGS